MLGMSMSGDRTRARRDRFRAISVYVHSTHVLLAAGTITAPAIAFAIEPAPTLVVGLAMCATLCVSAGSSLAVAARFAPHHPLTRWLRGRRSSVWIQGVVLLATLAIAVLAPVSSPPVISVALPLAWALLAVSGGTFWSGIVRMLVAALAWSLATFALDVTTVSTWEPLTLIFAALLALGVLGQDSIYALAIELDDLRTREAERAVLTERKRFAGDLHDVQGQHLGLITVEAELVSRLIDRADYSAAARHAERVEAITLEALEEMHRVVHANREVRLDEEIANAVRVLRSASIAVERDTMDIAGLSDEIDRLLGLTVREGITNVLKHTQASVCSIWTRQERRHGNMGVVLVVADSCLDSLQSTSSVDESGGTGLKTLAERYRRHGGTLDFTQDYGGRLAGWLPVRDHFRSGDIE